MPHPWPSLSPLTSQYSCVSLLCSYLVRFQSASMSSLPPTRDSSLLLPHASSGLTHDVSFGSSVWAPPDPRVPPSTTSSGWDVPWVSGSRCEEYCALKAVLGSVWTSECWQESDALRGGWRPGRMWVWERQVLAGLGARKVHCALRGRVGRGHGAKEYGRA